LEDSSKPNKEMPDAPPKKVKDENVEEPQPEPEVQSKEETKESTDVKEPETEEKVEPTSEEGADTQPKEKPTEAEDKEEKAKEPEKVEVKKDKPKKKVDRGPDFKYIVRFSNTDADGEKKVIYGLTSVKGIGVKIATLIADKTGIDRNTKIGDLTDAQVEKIQENIDNVSNNAPAWMLNHRKDYETGLDIHLISSDIDMKLRDEINIMKKIRSYRGIRHERGLAVRGQRTRANNRKGLALGVSKKRVIESK